MKLLFSVGILFSLSLHIILISIFVRWYPGKISNDLQWGDLIPFSDEKINKSNDSGKTTNNFSDKILIGKIFFPDIVLFREKKRQKRIKKNSAPQISLESILKQVEKFPVSLSDEVVSNKELSGQVGALLTLLIPATSQNNFSNEGRLNLNLGELRQYRHSLNEFLSEKWEVPIHLIERNYSALVHFEIKKNGRLLGWKIEESSNNILKKTLKKMLKNLQFLPSLPESYPEDSYRFGVKFTSTNLK